MSTSAHKRKCIYQVSFLVVKSINGLNLYQAMSFLLLQCFFTNKSVYLFYKSLGNNTNKVKKKIEVFSEINVMSDTSKVVNPSPVDIIADNS